MLERLKNRISISKNSDALQLIDPKYG